MIKSTQLLKIHPASGGLNVSLDETSVPPDQLVQADNIVFSASLSRKKRGGTSKWNASAITGTTNVMYLTDFWRTDGNTGTQTRKLVAVSNGKVWKDDGDGVFDDITGSFTLGAGMRTATEQFGDLLIFTFEDGTAPKKWNQTGNIADLGGTPPQAKYARAHKGRLWLAGDPGAPHKISYSAAFDSGDWTGTTAGSIQIDPGDGDPEGITALFPSFFGELIVAKKNSLYRISGSSPTDFAVSPISREIGCVSHNSVVAAANDLIFVSERGVHSLSTTANFGDVLESFLSAPIHKLIQEELRFPRLKYCYSVFVPELSSILIAFSDLTSGSTNNIILGFNITNKQWYKWTGLNANSLAIVDRDGKKELYLGLDNGFVYKYDTQLLNDAGTAFTSTIKTGFIYPEGSIGSKFKFLRALILARPTGSTITVKHQIDNNTQETQTFATTGGTKLLGTTFILGTDKLGPVGKPQPVDIFLNGIGNGIQLEMSLNNANTDMEILGYVIEVKNIGIGSRTS